MPLRSIHAVAPVRIAFLVVLDTCIIWETVLLVSVEGHVCCFSFYIFLFIF